MLSNTYNLCDDWGWYVDIESTKPQIELKTFTTYNKSNYRKFSLHFNRLEPILENKKYYDRNYDKIYSEKYYIEEKNLYHNIENDSLEDKFNEIDDKIDNNKLCKRNRLIYFVYKNLFGIGSTTIITLSLSYVIFFMI
jgi:hypothetical protein